MDLTWLLLLASWTALILILLAQARASSRLAGLERRTHELGAVWDHLVRRVYALEWNAAARARHPSSWAEPGAPFRAPAPVAPAFEAVAQSPARSAPITPSEPAPSRAAAWRARVAPEERPDFDPAPREDAEARDAAVSPPSPSVTPASEPPEPGGEWDWERWLGVRGAAALGGGVLVIALLYFLRYSIHEGWLTPVMRVGLGVLVSLGLIAAAELRFGGERPVAADWLRGAGFAGLFASIWAAQVVVGLFGDGVGFALSVLVTAGAIAMSLLRSSLPTALLGLSGGFAAPLALLGFEMASDRFAARGVWILGYVFVLDAAMVLLSARRRWWVLAALSLLVSSAYVGVWVQLGRGADVLAEQIALLTVFAAVFGALPAFVAKLHDDHPLAALVRAGALIVPAALSLLLLAQDAVVDHPAPIGLLLTALTATALLLGARFREARSAALATIGSLVVLAVWISRADVAQHQPELAALIALLATLHVFGPGLIGRLRWLDAASPAPAAHVSGAGFLCLAMVLVVAASFADPARFQLPVASLVGLTALALYAARGWRMRALAPTALVLSSAGLLSVVAAGRGWAAAASPGMDPASALAGLALVLAAARAWARREGATTASGASGDAQSEPSFGDELTVAVRGASVVGLLGALVFVADLSLGGVVFAVVAFTSLALSALRGSVASLLLLGALALGALVVAGFVQRADVDLWIVGLSVLLAAALSAPLGLQRDHVAPLRATLLAGGAGAVSLAHRFDAAACAPAWLALAAAAAVITLVGRRADDPREARAAWLPAIAAILPGLAARAALDGSVRVVVLSALGLGVIFVARRSSAQALLWIGGVEIGVAALRVLTPSALLPEEHALSLGWIAEVCAPTLACAAGWSLLRRAGDPPTSDRAALRALFGAAALLLGFLVTSAVLSSLPDALGLELQQARDLALSLAWAVYGVGLLVTGVRLENVALRWLSLALVLVTAGKVFLWDLGRLGDLYRVASLVGLAVAMLGISLLYQRLVFRRARPARVAAAAD